MLKKIYNISVKLSLIFLILVVVISIVGGNNLLNLFSFLSIKTAEIGTFLLYFLLATKSMYFILNKFITNRKNIILSFLRENNKYQREMGLIIFNILFIHGYIEIVKYVFNFNILVYNFITVLIPTIVLIYMELTSFKFFQGRIRRWKKSHTIVWLTVPFVLLHVILLSDHVTKYLIATFVLIMISIFEILTSQKKGYTHFTYLIIGILLIGFQFKGTRYYNDVILATPSIESTTTLNINENNSTIQEATYESPYTQENMEKAENSITDDSYNIATTEDSNITDNTETSDTTDTTDDESNTIFGNDTSSNIYENGTFTGEGRGHKGTITVQTTIENDDILSIEVSQHEDAPWWSQVTYIIDEVVENDSTEGIETVAGATHSSEGLLDAINSSLEDAQI